MADNIKVRVTCYEDYLVIETVNPIADANFVPAGGTKIGCVVIDTGKYLGMSDEAFELMKTTPKGGDDIGEISTWKSDKGQCFGWLGPLKRIVKPSACECSREGIIDLKYISIENKIPVQALEGISRDRANNK